MACQVSREASQTRSQLFASHTHTHTHLGSHHAQRPAFLFLLLLLLRFGRNYQQRSIARPREVQLDRRLQRKRRLEECICGRGQRWHTQLTVVPLPCVGNRLPVSSLHRKSCFFWDTLRRQKGSSILGGYVNSATVFSPVMQSFH